MINNKTKNNPTTQYTRKHTKNSNNCNLMPQTLVLVSVCLIGIDAFAAGMTTDTLERAADGIFNPIINVINTHYSKAIFASGLIGAAITPGGDLRAKAIGMGIGCLLSGLMVTAIKTSFGL